MKLTLIRHSKTILDFSIPNAVWNLSDEGVSLAEELAKTPETKSLDIICSSFQTKALHTALIIAKANNTFLEPDNGLAELTAVTNGKIDNYEQTMHEFYAGNIERVNDGETVEEARMRINSAIETIASRHADKENIGIVSHGNILAIFAAQYCDKTALELHSTISMPDLAILDWDSKHFIKFFGEK